MYPFAEPDPSDFAVTPAAYRIKHATEHWERVAAAALRRSVFCDEQGLFAGDDRDAIDAHAQTLVAVSCIAGMSEQVVGTVRIHRAIDGGAHPAPASAVRTLIHKVQGVCSAMRSREGAAIDTAVDAAVDATIDAPVETEHDDAGLWFGSRLAVHRDYRGLAWLGSELIHLAVSTAHAQGCTRFLAHVQARNAALFRHLHWRSLQMLTLHGQPHHLMQADLAHYAPCHDGERGFLTTLRQAA